MLANLPEFNMPNRDLHDRRRDYEGPALLREDLQPDPLDQFSEWMEEATLSGILDPTAMTLATADRWGRPHARIVLLKAFGPDGFVFYTHALSEKGRELAINPHAALTFYWDRLDRQVRIEGRVSTLASEAVCAYFHQRPRDSQLSALISEQSQPVDSRETLERRLQAANAAWPQTVPCPPDWQGYCVMPDRYEFWQGRPNRLHDRFAYTRRQGRWQIMRLAP